MTQIAPNLTALIGEHVGAYLITHVGSLTNLATVSIQHQLFRFLVLRRHYLGHSSHVATHQSMVWYFTLFGEKLKDHVKERLKFYETGEVPQKNVVVMEEAMYSFSWAWYYGKAITWVANCCMLIRFIRGIYIPIDTLEASIAAWAFEESIKICIPLSMSSVRSLRYFTYFVTFAYM